MSLHRDENSGRRGEEFRIFRRDFFLSLSIALQYLIPSSKYHGDSLTRGFRIFSRIFLGPLCMELELPPPGLRFSLLSANSRAQFESAVLSECESYQLSVSAAGCGFFKSRGIGYQRFVHVLTIGVGKVRIPRSARIFTKLTLVRPQLVHESFRVVHLSPPEKLRENSPLKQVTRDTKSAYQTQKAGKQILH